MSTISRIAPRLPKAILITPSPSRYPLIQIGQPTPSFGCYYLQVQCIRAPCDPILVCPSPVVTPSTETHPLQTTKLSNGQLKVINIFGGFEITTPATYDLAGSSENFSVGFSGADSNQPGPYDFISLIFSIDTLTSDSLLSQVQKEYMEIRTTNGQEINYTDIKTINLGEFSGYTFNSTFLIPQKHTFLNLENSKYLYILSSYSDDNNRGYSRQLEEIFSSFKPTTGNLQPSPGSGCKTGGCSGELCVDASSDDTVSICIYRPEWECYKEARCERQPNGACGWTQNSQYLSCLQNLPSR